MLQMTEIFSNIKKIVLIQQNIEHTSQSSSFTLNISAKYQT